MVQHKVHTPGASKVLTHKHTHIRTDTHIQTHTHIHTHTHMHAYTRTQPKPWADGAAQGTHAWHEQGADTHAHIRTHNHIYTHTYTYIHTHTHARISNLEQMVQHKVHTPGASKVLRLLLLLLLLLLL